MNIEMCYCCDEGIRLSDNDIESRAGKLIDTLAEIIGLVQLQHVDSKICCKDSNAIVGMTLADLCYKLSGVMSYNDSDRTKMAAKLLAYISKICEISNAEILTQLPEVH